MLTVAGRKTSSAGWIATSRILSVLILLMAVDIFYLAVS